MINNIPNTAAVSSGSPETKRKVLTLKNTKAIEYISCHRNYSDSNYAEENRLLVTLNGTVKLIHGKSEYNVGTNQMAFLKSNTLVEYQTINSPTEQQTEFIIFTLGYDLVKEFSTMAQLPTVAKTFNNEIVINTLKPDILIFTSSLNIYLKGEIKVEETLVKIKLLELLYSLKTFENGLLDLFLDLRKEMRPNITMVVEDNFMNPLSIDQLARLAGRSLSSFRRDFLSVYNMPPSKWIRDRRLKKSREFLVNTNMSVTDICYTLGFENIAHFSRLFKSQFGYSPTEYRVQLLSA